MYWPRAFSRVTTGSLRPRGQHLLRGAATRDLPFGAFAGRRQRLGPGAGLERQAQSVDDLLGGVLAIRSPLDQPAPERLARLAVLGLAVYAPGHPRPPPGRSGRAGVAQLRLDDRVVQRLGLGGVRDRVREMMPP